VIFKFPEMTLSTHLSFPDQDEVGNFRWVNDDQVVISIAQQSVRLEGSGSTGELFAMNAVGSKKKYLFGYRAGTEERWHFSTSTSAKNSSWNESQRRGLFRPGLRWIADTVIPI